MTGCVEEQESIHTSHKEIVPVKWDVWRGEQKHDRPHVLHEREHARDGAFVQRVRQL
jgi:hypothetical protein